MRAIPWLVCCIVAVGCSRQQPDVVLITVDTLRGDRVSAYSGKGSTPNMDALIASGTYFPNTISPIPRTTPAVASLMTGLYPKNHGSLEVGQKVRNGRLLAEHFKARGYVTIGVSANSAASGTHGLATGFDVFVERGEIADALGDRLWQDANFWDRGDADIGWAQAATEAALAEVARVDGDRPIFLWILYMDPHAFYAPPSDFPQPEGTRCHALYRHVLRGGGDVGRAVAGLDPRVESAVGECLTLYEAEVSYADHWIGELRTGLAMRDRPQLTVLTADHGESFGEDGLYFEHGYSLMNASVRVPLAFAGPGVPEGVRSERVASLVDVSATLSALADVPLPASDGVDLFAKCPNSACGSRAVFALGANSVWNYHFDRAMTGWAPGRVCANRDDWTLCRQYSSSDAFSGEVLFNRDKSGDLETPTQNASMAWRLREQFSIWPPMSARDLAVVMEGRKLILRPRPEGGYRSTVYAFGDTLDEIKLALSEEEILRLQEELAWWSTGVEYDDVDLSQVGVLRSLGYLQ